MTEITDHTPIEDPKFYKGLTVAFTKSLSQYKTDKIVSLIKLMADVESIDPVITENVHDHINRQRVRVEYYEKFREILEK